MTDESLDSFVAMEGRGPTDGTPVKMNLIIAGTDVVATDATACRIMGFNPNEVKHIRRASEKGLGSIQAQVLSQATNQVARPFKPAKMRIND